ncbi:MAG: aminodeoxychorismate/anthranilate synthase component II [Deltaproteobacteria bacterium]|nr:aminodeoxychorismate/anthranilate synthase component II [Deltaproteobacteria bacterium]
MVLVLDNYDSFTFNLVQALWALGAEVRVVKSDQVTVEALHRCRPSRVLVSPGPGAPPDAGVSVAFLREARVPVLGVCLGHQCLAEAFGARVVRAREPVHGRAAEITHDARGLFQGLPQGFPAARYHSLTVDPGSVPPGLEVCAHAEDGAVMALRHRQRPLVGVQFHPESVLSPDGPAILRNFLDDRL